MKPPTSLDDALERVARWARDGDGALDRPASATPPTCCRRSSPAASCPTCSPTRPRRTTRSTATCRTACRSRGGRPCASAIPTSTSRAPMAGDGTRTCAAMLELQRRGAVTFDYGNNIRAQAQKAGVADAFDIPGFVPEYIRPLFCEGKGPFRWVGALRRSGRHRGDRSRRCSSCFPTTRRWRAGSAWRGERVAFQGCRRASAGSATASARAFGLRLNELVRTRRGHGADRHRPRSPRLRIGGLAQPRDRGHARRQRRHRRLADPERAAQRVVPAPPGCRCTTAAASASATRCTPAW